MQKVSVVSFLLAMNFLSLLFGLSIFLVWILTSNGDLLIMCLMFCLLTDHKVVARVVQSIVGPDPPATTDWTWPTTDQIDFSNGWQRIASSRTWLWRVGRRFSFFKIRETQINQPINFLVLFDKSSEFWDVFGLDLG